MSRVHDEFFEQHDFVAERFHRFPLLAEITIVERRTFRGTDKWTYRYSRMNRNKKTKSRKKSWPLSFILRKKAKIHRLRVTN